MKARNVTTLILLLAMSSAFGAQSANNPHPSQSADSDWAALVLSNVPPTRGKKTRDEHKAEHARQVVQARNVAQAAKDFYTRFPNDARVVQARKLEAISGLRAVTSDDHAQELEAVATAKKFRLDSSIPKKDRLDVATSMDTQDMGLRLRSGLATDRSAEQKKLIELWRAEFGDMPEIESYAVSTARLANPQVASALASQVLRSPVAEARNKKEAKMINDRAMLLGKPINLAVPLVDGGELELGTQQGHVTVVVVWSPAKPESLDALAMFTQSLPRGAQIVCLALGGTRGDVMRVRHKLPAVGYFGHAPLGVSANAAAHALKLQLAPYVYVLNTSGVLSDFGPLNRLPDLLTRAGVTVKKSL